ncbi:MAG TPA: hypothetical protein DCM40_31215 [Maribacter sp.]|nr:hypothetical protein [Maribacter sp.]|tara:strand:+ start:225 stop:548 length:324 start_codon:yes stop_codon:yes gene_type:complete
MYDKGKFIRGPISVNQLLEFSKYGVNAVRIFLYIRMQEGIMVSRGELSRNAHTFIKIPNKKLEELVGVHRSIKWEKLRVLEEKKLIDLKLNGQGRAPEAKILVPRLH